MKTTITFEISENHISILDNLNKKYTDQLTQEELLDIRTIIEKSLRYDNDKVEDEEYNTLFKGLSKLINPELYRPMDQRSLPEFVLASLMKYIEELETEVISISIGEQFAESLANDSIFLNDIQAKNYIRAFWDDFLEEDCEGWAADEIFKRPTAFLESQVGLMAGHLVQAIFEQMEEDDTLCFVDEFTVFAKELSASELSDLVY